jgi:OmpA-OmpF porin, OOP family
VRIPYLIGLAVAQLAILLHATFTLANPGETTHSRKCEVYFEHNSSKLTPEARMVVGDVVRSIKIIHPRMITIIGYADRTGSAAYNALLSRRRALAVRDYMKGALYPERYFFKIAWRGEYDLPYPTRDGIPEALNRCVGFEIKP